ncbi:phosphatase PAP2 family protein [Deferribacterales bacterium RsTz2092]|nr:phosphoesterase [Deferribacterales bacterium]
MIKRLCVLLLIFFCGLTVPIYADTRSAGNTLMYAVPLYALALTGYHLDGYGSLQLIAATGVTQLASEGLKSATKEKRPDYKSGDSKKSFPSGHAAGAFSGATFIHRRYGLNQAIVPYMAATFVAYSRVDARKHYVHDVVAGAAIAGLFSYLIARPLEKKVEEEKADNVSFSIDSLYFTDKEFVVSVSLAW